MTALDVSGAELTVAHVVSCHIPGSGEEVRGYVFEIDGEHDEVRVAITSPERLAGHSVSVPAGGCTILKGPAGSALHMHPAPGRENGLAEVEAA